MLTTHLNKLKILFEMLRNTKGVQKFFSSKGCLIKRKKVRIPIVFTLDKNYLISLKCAICSLIDNAYSSDLYINNPDLPPKTILAGEKGLS